MGAQVHFINVFPGDCTVIKHASGHVSMIDICDGNIATVNKAIFEDRARAGLGGILGNFGMCNKNTNPIDYCAGIGITNIFRFILTHPDMDHMDGFNRLMDEIGIQNYWDSTSRRAKPDFGDSAIYLEEDWDRYEKVRDGKDPNVNVLTPLAGTQFKYANKNEDDTSGGDGLQILAPDKNLLNDADENDDINDGSYVILYNSIGGKVLICGDAHDKSFEYIKENHLNDVEDVAVMLAPHHGRDSNRSYDFLDFIKPKLTIIGCAPCQHIDYGQWNRRELPTITSNQAGNIVLDIDELGITISVENDKFADKANPDSNSRNSQGYKSIYRIAK